jgi:N6-L-threonylcarbamoyladenine synthase
MYVLGIETSCDETSAGIVKDGAEVMSNIVSSSLQFHQKYGGVVPEIASRMQLETITQVADSAVTSAGIRRNDIALVSVTCGPGLLGSLLVGISFAKSVSLGLNVPLLGIDHLTSHIYASFLDGGVRLPFVGLVVSGGHTSLYYVKDFDAITCLGATRDDACGEAFDKVAKILRLGYPGGPFIEKIAKKGNPYKIRFTCSKTENPLDFSFSGIKTAVLYYVQKSAKVHSSRLGQFAVHSSSAISSRLKNDIAASFQEAAIDTLIRKSFRACQMKKVNRLVIGGGVAANNRLREKFYQAAREKDYNVYFPSKEFCMDNAAMVAGLAYRLFKKGRVSGLDLNACLD